MDIRPIRSEQDYEAAVREIARLMEAAPREGTEAFDKLDVLATLVEAYERENHPVGSATPVETIRFHLDRLGWSQARLAREAGIHASHLSSVLNGRRALTLTQIQKLSATLEIPVGRLIENPYVDEMARAQTSPPNTP